MKRFKYILIAIVAIFMGLFSTSCEDIGVGSLEKPPGGDVTIDTVFSNTEYAERVLWKSYRSLRSGIIHRDRSHMIGNCLQSEITDLTHSYAGGGYGPGYSFYSGALNSSIVDDTDYWSSPLCVLPFKDSNKHGIYTFSAIRHCYIFLDNVDNVPDMDDDYRAQLKAEARTLLAYNMMELFRNYGGIPWIGKSYSPDDDFTNPRMTVEATVDSIAGLLDKAIPDLPWQIEESQRSNWAGRFTQAGAMALKTRLLLFAASPIFNSDQPYRDGEASTQKITWYGDYQQSRWQRAADAAKVLIDKVESNGVYALEQAATPDVKGYRDVFFFAYFNRRSSETLISVRDGWQGPKRWGGGMYDVNLNYGGGTCTNEFMRMFPMADGTLITDPASGWDEAVDPLGCEGLGNARTYNRDPRMYETMLINNDDWGGQIAQTYSSDAGNGKNFLRPAASGNIWVRKFIPADNPWNVRHDEHQFPYMRLPEIYLSYAEAMNELGNQTEAYKYINMVRNRVGLKNVEDAGTWNTETLRNQILTERVCEFGFEQVRWHDMIRHKLRDSFANELHNVRITKNADGTYSYSYPSIQTTRRAWWANFDTKWYLTPFPLKEIQKGYGLIQNPGW